MSIGLPWRRQFVDPRSIVELIRILWTVARPGVRMLEVGSGGGQSSVWIAIVALAVEGQLDCVDVWDDPAACKMFGRNTLSTTLRDVVTPHQGNSADILPTLPPKTYDLIFIDADHRYESVKRDIRLAIPLLRDGGILCGHDYEAELVSLAVPNLDQVMDQDTAWAMTVTGEWAVVHPGVIRAVTELLPGHTANWNIWQAAKETPSCEPSTAKEATDGSSSTPSPRSNQTRKSSGPTTKKEADQDQPITSSAG